MNQQQQKETRETMFSEIHDGIIKIFCADDEIINKILGELRNSTPKFDFEDIIESIAEKHDFDIEYVSDIIKSVINLQDFYKNICKNHTFEEFIEIIIEDISDNSKFDELDVTDEKIVNFENRLSSFLREDNILQSAIEARKLLLEYQNVFLNSNVTTDIRPIFNTKNVVGDQDSINSALIVHTLKLVYKTQRSAEEFFVTLSSGEIAQITDQFNDALRKEQILKSFFDKNTVAHLSPDSE